MKSENLLDAIGNLDENILMENSKKGGTVRRIGWRVALIAAVVAGLALTAAATPLIRNAMKGAQVKTDEAEYFMATNPENGESPQVQKHDVLLEVDINVDAPKRIETYYAIPEVSGEFRQYLGHVYKDEMLASFGWIEDGAGRQIFFTQLAGNAYKTEDYVAHVWTNPDEKPSCGMKMLGEILGYLIEQKEMGNLPGKRIFCWSDGDYLFYLEVPSDYSDAQLEEMVASIQPVEDITPYLSTMTDAEIEEFFGMK